MTHTYGSKLIIIGSDNGLSPDRHQAIIWTNAVILLTQPLGTKFSEILIKIVMANSDEDIKVPIHWILFDPANHYHS